MKDQVVVGHQNERNLAVCTNISDETEHVGNARIVPERAVVAFWIVRTVSERIGKRGAEFNYITVHLFHLENERLRCGKVRISCHDIGDEGGLRLSSSTD